MTRGKSTRDPLKIFAQEFRLLQHIISSGKQSVQIRCNSKADGIALRHRMYKARVADRATSPTRDSIFDTIRIHEPTLTTDGRWTMKASIVDEDELIGLIEEE